MWKAPSDYEIGSVYPARVLYIHPFHTTVYMTMLSHTCRLQAHDDSVKLYVPCSVVEKAKVYRVSRTAIVLKLDKRSKGIVTLKHLAQQGNLQTLYPVGSKQKCQIITYNYLDGIYSCVLEK